MSDGTSAAPGQSLSHGQASDAFEEDLARVRARIVGRGDLADVTAAEQLAILDQLTTGSLGRFMLQNRGWDGLWTDFVVEYPERGRVLGAAPDGRPLTDLERLALETFPTILATQERARHFALAIQDCVRSGAVLASVPCGLMRDLLGRDFSAVDDVHLVGMDIDQDSLTPAARLADEYGFGAVSRFVQCDAWDLGVYEAFDLIASNGLNIYEPDDGRVTDLYRGFFSALKPNGVLVTSFLTPPPTLDPASEWNLAAVDLGALRMQRIVSVDIMGSAFDCYRSSATTRQQLEDAGFAAPELIWDRARMYPTVVARKV